MKAIPVEDGRERELRLAMEYVRATYPSAFPSLLGVAMGGVGFWILTGTGFTLSTGLTEDAAWINSAALLKKLIERDPVHGEDAWMTGAKESGLREQ